MKRLSSTGTNRSKPSRRAALAALLVLPGVLGAAPQSFGSLPENRLREILAGRLEPFAGASLNPAGVVAGLWRSGATRYVTQALPGAERMNADTVFEIGGVTELFTGVLLADMVGRGEVSLDDPVDRYLPDGVHAPTFDGRKITLLDLATQTSGLPLTFAYRYRDNTAKQLYTFLGKYKLTHPIGSEYKYSEVGVGLLGHALARRASSSYQQLLERRILRPLGLTHTAVVLTPAMRARFAQGIDQYGGTARVVDFDVLAGAAGLRSTARDMIRFLGAAATLRPASLAAAFQEALRPRRPTADGGFIGLLWSTTPDGRVLWHTGQTGGFYAFAGISQDRQLATILLANVAGIGLDEIGLLLLDPSAGPVEDFPPVVHVDDATLQKYVGSYRILKNAMIYSNAYGKSAATESLAIRRDRDGLIAQYDDGQPLRIYPYSQTGFYYRAIDVRLQFVAGNGSASKVLLTRRGLQYEADREP